MKDWQPIETAPKDGTTVLVWNGIGCAKAAENRYDDGWHFAYGCSECRAEIHPQPTLWQPLPEPPQ